MKVNINELLLFFDELMPPTNEELGIYWFRSTRSDGLIVRLSFCIHECHVDVSIRNATNVDVASLNLENCSEIRILDEKRKCLEILHDSEKGRCFLSLLGSSIMEYSE